jgi:hypothetical protein
MHTRGSLSNWSRTLRLPSIELLSLKSEHDTCARRRGAYKHYTLFKILWEVRLNDAEACMHAVRLQTYPGVGLSSSGVSRHWSQNRTPARIAVRATDAPERRCSQGGPGGGQKVSRC